LSIDDKARTTVFYEKTLASSKVFVGGDLEESQQVVLIYANHHATLKAGDQVT
jgi:hypothetical protein